MELEKSFAKNAKFAKLKTYKLKQDDFGTLCICAIRYCQGRQTYMPSLVREIIIPHLKELSDRDLGVMIEDCGYQERFNLYGDHMIDLPGWIKWRETLEAEQRRREAETVKGYEV